MSDAKAKHKSDGLATSVFHDLILGGIAGTLCRIPTHPLDTCKTVAFASDSGSASAVAAARRIWSREGIRGFYRGVGITAIAACPGNALYFVSYEYARDWVQRHETGCMLPRPLLHLGSGFFAEVISCVIWVPVDVIKERLQAQGPEVAGRYRSSWHGFTTCLRQESFKGLYKGYCSTLASFGPFSAVYFACFEVFNQWLAPYGMGAFGQGLVAAFAGNAAAAIITNPLELVKTRLQIQKPVLEQSVGVFGSTRVFGYQYGSFLGGLSEVAKVHGVRGLWRGSIARALHTGPNAALTMGMYRWLKDVYPAASTNDN